MSPVKGGVSLGPFPLCLLLKLLSSLTSPCQRDGCPPAPRLANLTDACNERNLNYREGYFLSINVHFGFGSKVRVFKNPAECPRFKVTNLYSVWKKMAGYNGSGLREEREGKNVMDEPGAGGLRDPELLPAKVLPVMGPSRAPGKGLLSELHRAGAAAPGMALQLARS